MANSFGGPSVVEDNSVSVLTDDGAAVVAGRKVLDKSVVVNPTVVIFGIISLLLGWAVVVAGPVINSSGGEERFGWTVEEAVPIVSFWTVVVKAVVVSGVVVVVGKSELEDRAGRSVGRHVVSVVVVCTVKVEGGIGVGVVGACVVVVVKCSPDDSLLVDGPSDEMMIVVPSSGVSVVDSVVVLDT